MELENGSIQDDRFLYNRAILHFHDYGELEQKNIFPPHSLPHKPQKDIKKSTMYNQECLCVCVEASMIPNG